MKKITVTYSTGGKILAVDDNSAYFEQENMSLQIDAKIETAKNVRAYIKASNGNSDVTAVIQPTNGIYSVVIKEEYMSKGTLYVGFEIVGDRGYMERFEPVKVYIDSFINPGEGNADNVYVVTVEVAEVETLSPDGQAYVENVGTKKDVKLKFGIPQGAQGTQGPKGEKGDKGDKGDIGEKGDKGDKGTDGNDGYTPVKGKDYYTTEEKEQFVQAVMDILPVDEEADHESVNLISNGAITRFVLEQTLQLFNRVEQEYNPKSENPQSGLAVAQAIAQLLGSAPENLNTLEELAKALNEDENFSATVLAEIAKKVDKVDGKGLSANDFTDEFKAMLENVDLTEIVPGSANLTTSQAVFSLFANFATSINEQIEEVKISIPTTDEELSETSENPVQNKVVAEKFNIHENMLTTALRPIGGTTEGLVYRADLQKTLDTIIENDDEEAEYPEIEAIGKVFVETIYNGENIGFMPHALKLKDTKAREMIGDIETALDSIIVQQEAIIEMQNCLIGGDAE